MCLSVDLTVAQVAKRMAEVRTDAVILLGQQGDMKGIVTDHDVARHASLLRCFALTGYLHHGDYGLERIRKDTKE